MFNRLIIVNESNKLEKYHDKTQMLLMEVNDNDD